MCEIALNSLNVIAAMFVDVFLLALVLASSNMGILRLDVTGKLNRTEYEL